MADIRIDRPYLPITGKNPVLEMRFYHQKERERGKRGVEDDCFYGSVKGFCLGLVKFF